jgi:hypothetical protein
MLRIKGERGTGAAATPSLVCAMRCERQKVVFGCAVVMSKSSYVLLLLLHIVTTSDRFLIIERLDGEEFVR